MTDAAAQAAWRWALADEQARAVLAHDAPRRIPTPLVLGALAVLIVPLVVAALMLPSASVGRYVLSMAMACLGLCAVVVDLVVGVIARRRGTSRDPVVKPLSRREQSAVRRAITGRVAEPEERLVVVRAAAVQTATGAGLVSASGRLLVFTALSVSSTALWFVYVVVAALAFVALVVVVHQVAAARRYLDALPAHATI